ncbi:F3F20.2 protein [Citrus sinensis]|uniref:F3F20.2 protein n=1 Tax=Citrus sinensis TaxID=2711 RepID=A0ACB8LN99_CITSI|nr:F3F20.2 protein [Citrus sinensis]
MEGGGGGGKVINNNINNGGEVRRIHIVYFLSRLGQVDHPHLIRVHHLSRNGVYLRVGMLRNDEEAITAEQQKQPACSLTEVKEEEIQQLEDPKMETPRSQSHVQEQESSPVYAYAYGSACLERSTLTDDTMNSIIQKKGTLPSSSSSSSSKSNKKLSSSSSKSNKKLSSSSSSAQFAKSKSCSNGASNILRNLMKCGAVDTKNGVVVNVNRPPAALVESKPNTTRLSKSVNLPPAVLDTTGDNDGALNLICRGDQHQLGGSARFFVTTTSTWNNQHHPLYGARKSFDGTTSTTASNNKKKDGFAGPKPVSSAYHYNYKPVGGPTCSQCGKLFKPEKLQKHMKSCKGMKASSKSSTTAEPVSFEKTSSSSSGPPQSLRSTNLSPQPQSSGQEPSTSSSYLLTN